MGNVLQASNLWLLDRENAQKAESKSIPLRYKGFPNYWIQTEAWNRERNLVGVKLVSEAAKKGLFDLNVESERSGLIQFFNGAFEWFRKTSHRTKEEISKEEAPKMILFADHLIKLLRRLNDDTQGTQESALVPRPS